jgi:hypothetical protein
MIEVLYNLAAEGGLLARGFVQALPFWLPFQLRQIQSVTGCSCTKHVPFRYRFDEKPARNRGCDGKPVSLAQILAGRRRPVAAQISLGISSPGNLACFGHCGQGQGEMATRRPPTQGRAVSAPRNGILGETLPKHSRQ